MCVESNLVFVLIFALNLAFVLFPIDRRTASNTDVGECIFVDFINLLRLYEIGHRLSIPFKYTSV